MQFDDDARGGFRAKRRIKMSTDYVILPPISASELFDGRLEKFGVREHVNEETTEDHRCLVDGNNYLWLDVADDGNVTGFKRYAPNGNPSRIIDAIFSAFEGHEIFSEYEPQYWGFETQDEWHAFMMALAKKDDERCMVELVKYLRGEPHDFVPGTVGMIWAENVKTFFGKDPTLILPENRDKLLKLWKDSLHLTAVVVEPSPEDIELVKMLATHEDDLPQA
jgi:hypothetical protein